MLIFRAGIHKMLVRIASGEDPVSEDPVSEDPVSEEAV